MRSGFLPARVVHVHPTRTCNLACAHCYSASGPSIRSALDVDLLIDALGYLRGEGFEVVSISGGEPLLYRELNRLLAAAASCGYRVHVVTNGTLLTAARFAALREHVDLMAVSLDGRAETHNRVRGRPDAFARATSALQILAAGDLPFGIAFGVSSRSLPDVPWAMEHARALGAGLLHLRPLVAQGRAADLAESWMLTPEDCARLVVLAQILDEGLPGVPRVQVDLVATEEVSGARDQFAVLRRDAHALSLSDTVNPLVIDEAGQLLAFTYGVHPDFTVGRLTGDWRRDIAEFKERGVGRVGALLEAAFDAVDVRTPGYLDWFAHLTAMSHTMGLPGGQDLENVPRWTRSA